MFANTFANFADAFGNFADAFGNFANVFGNFADAFVNLSKIQNQKKYKENFQFMPSFIPQGNNERIAWSLNFEDKFLSIAPSVGFSTAEAEALVKDAIMMRFVIENGITAQAYSKASNSFKYDMLNGVENGASEPVMPLLNSTEPPAAFVDSGIIDRLSKAMARVKTAAGYNDGIGDILLINGAEKESDISPFEKPLGKAYAMPNMVRIDWTKGKFDGVIVEGQRGDETVWQRLDRDTRSPFDDERPNAVPGKPEERRYRLIYFLNDEIVGTYSDVIIVVTFA